MADFILSAFADEAHSDLSEQIRICDGNSLKFIEMRGVNGKPLVDHSKDEVREIKKVLDANGFKLSAVGSPFGKINIRDDFKPHLEHFKRGIDIAHILEAKFIRIFSFFIDKSENPDSREAEVMERMSAFIENSNGIICAHENGKNIYGDIPERCLKLYNNFSGKLRLIFDPAGFVQCHIDTLEAYELLGDFVEYMHIKDACCLDGSVTLAGLGDGRLEELLNLFVKQKGERFLTLEPHLTVLDNSTSPEKAKEFAKKFYTYKNSEEAFNTAAASLKSLLCANGFVQSKDLERGYGIWTK